MSILMLAGFAWVGLNVLLVLLLFARSWRARHRRRRLWSVGHRATYLNLKRY